MDIPDWALVHKVTVEAQTGEGGLGDNYGPPVEVACFVDTERRLVRDKGGAEVVSESTVLAALADAAKFPIDSRVTLPDGSQSYVLKTARRDDGGMGAPQHAEVSLR